MLAPETVLQGRYRIVRQLGQGGMGAVYEAVDGRLDTTVALKETLFADERLRKQFEREARLLARMHHPALPRVSDHFSESDGQFLVMQFVAGDDLAEMIARRSGPFPPGEVLKWADQLLDALDYLHTQDPQIIHRDIKPQNLKLTSRGQIILLDFGLAKGQASAVSRVTSSASIFGYTPNYAPLEQIQGLGTDARSDIYALGATLYHLMTGVKPPDALTRAAAIVNGQSDPLKLATEVNSAAPSGVAQVLARAMAQNREQRYPTASAMRRALQAAGETATVGGRSEADTVLFPPSATTVAAATRADVRKSTVQTGESTLVQAAEVPRKNRVTPWTMAAVAVLVLGLGAGAFYAYKHRNNPVSANAAVEASDQSNAAPEPSAVDERSNGNTSAIATTPQLSNDAEARAAAEAKPVKRNEQAAKDKEKAVNDEEKGTADKHAGTQQTPARPRPSGEARAEQDTPAEGDIPDVNPPDVPRIGHPRGRRGVRGATVRNFPDGTQLITSPDGTRVVVRPDGTRRVFRPGERIDRRKAWP